MTWNAQNVLPRDAQLAAGSGASAISIPATSSVTLYSGPVTDVSYSIALDVAGQAAPAVPFTKISMIWKDGPGGNTVDLQQWFVINTNVAPASNNARVCGRGPSRSGFVTILARNYDSAAITLEFEFFQSSRAVTRHDWRSVSNNISGTYTYAGIAGTFSTPVSAPGTLLLGATPTANVPGNGITGRVNALFAGEAQFFFSVFGSAALNVEMRLYQVDPDLAQPNVIYDNVVTAPAGTFVPVNIPFVSLPRCPVVMNFQNFDAVNSVQVSYSLVAQEFAS